MDALLATFKALGDATRLRIVRILQMGAFHVKELVEILGMGQSRVSRHLGILHQADLVAPRREGSRVWYALTPRWRSGAAGDALLRELGDRLRDGLEDSDREAVSVCFARRRELAARFFRDVAPRWDDRRDRVQGPPDHLEGLVRRVAPHECVVDLGTGTGVLLPVLSERAAKVIGIDQSAEMLREAQTTVRTLGLANVELRLGALEHLPLADGQADVMIANMVLHHVAHPPEALAEVRRGLRPRGRLVVADFIAHGREEFRQRLGDLWLGFEAEELRHWLEDAGLEPESWEEEPARDDRPPVFLATARKREEGRAVSAA